MDIPTITIVKGRRNLTAEEIRHDQEMLHEDMKQARLRRDRAEARSMEFARHYICKD